MAPTNRKHSLLYFDAAGRAEMIRICLTIADGVDWTDERFKFVDWASKYKPKTPLGSVPVLTIDGVEYVQSVALARYAGRLAGWYPTGDDDPLEALKVDQVLESLNELMAKSPRSGDPQEFYKLRAKFQENEMTAYAQFLESMIQRNEGGVGFTAKPTIADLALNLTVKNIAKGNWDHIEMTFFEKYPGIMATVKMIDEHPDIQAYYAANK